MSRGFIAVSFCYALQEERLRKVHLRRRPVLPEFEDPQPRRLLPLQPHKPGGDRLHDLVRPGEDPGDPDIPPRPGDRVFLAVAVAAE